MYVALASRPFQKVGKTHIVDVEHKCYCHTLLTSLGWLGLGLTTKMIVVTCDY